VKVSCASKYDKCKRGKIIIKGAKNLKKSKGRNTFVAKGKYAVAPGKSKTVSLRMSVKARKLFRNHRLRSNKKLKGLKKLRVKVTIRSGEDSAGRKAVIKRVGRVK